ncbi:MAG: hypothetical protein MN733_17950 [Nitrososphaera sp.]|nr:hypothetical protein [Nitrososphaera sp.]
MLALLASPWFIRSADTAEPFLDRLRNFLYRITDFEDEVAQYATDLGFSKLAALVNRDYVVVHGFFHGDATVPVK